MRHAVFHREKTDSGCDRMKKLIDSAPVTLTILYSFIPLLYLIGRCAGLTLVLRFGPELIGILGIYSLVILFNLDDHKLEMDKTNIILSILLMPLAFFSGLCVLSNNQSISTVVLSLVCIFCGFVFLKKTTQNRNIALLQKFVGLALAVLIVAYSLIVPFLNAYNATVSEPVTSPGGTYSAQMTGSKPNRTVKVYENGRNIELYVFYYEDTPQRIYIKNANGNEDPTISFTDEHTLIVDGTAYPIE